MIARPKTLDVTNSPELGHLAEEVYRTGETRILRLHDEDIAIIIPITSAASRRQRRPESDADVEAFRAAAGGWDMVDVDRFLEANARSRQLSTRQPTEL